MNVFPTNDYRYYLQHHGIKGQQWGVRNAEWYPIAEWKASMANKTAEKKEQKAWRAESEYETAKRGRERYVNRLERKAAKRKSQYEKLGIDATSIAGSKRSKLKAAKKAYKERDRKIQDWYDSEERKIESGYKKFQNLSDKDYERELAIDNKAQKMWADSKKQYKDEVDRINKESKARNKLYKAERAQEEYETAKNLSDKYLSGVKKKAEKRRSQADEARQNADNQHAELLKRALHDPNLMRKHVNEIPEKDVEAALNRFNRERRVEQAARDKNTVLKKDVEQYVIGSGKVIVAGYGTYIGLKKVYDALNAVDKIYWNKVR